MLLRLFSSCLVAALFSISAADLGQQPVVAPPPSAPLVPSFSAFSLPSSTSIPLPLGSTVSAVLTPTVCNNSPQLCQRTYDSITYIGAHDAAFLRDASTGFTVAGNQFLNATRALSAGLRMLQAQVHLQDGVLRLCHSTCFLLDAGTLQNWLTAINVWMENNPTDVVTLLLVNSDNAAASVFGAAFDGSGLSKIAYTHPSASAAGRWPTLQTMISSGKRLVVFVASITTPSPAYPFLMTEWNYMFETVYDVMSPTGFNCTVDRPSGPQASGGAVATSKGYIGLLNHMLEQVIVSSIYVPDMTDINATNSADPNVQGSVGQHLQLCHSLWGVQPQFVLIDFWDQGSAVQAADAMNGLSTSLISGRVIFQSLSAAGVTVRPTTWLVLLGSVAASVVTIAVG